MKVLWSIRCCKGKKIKNIYIKDQSIELRQTVKLSRVAIFDSGPLLNIA